MSVSQRLTLAVLSAAALIDILDGSIVTVAMPAIQRDLGFGAAGVTWTVNAYLIAFAGLLLLSGRIGDLVGRSRMFLAGNAVFTVASLLAGAAQNTTTLIAARFAQGIGGALTASVVLGILVTRFPGERERARALGVFSFTGAAGASIGQVLGGVLTDALNWHWIFLINVPIGVAVVVLGARVLPADRGAGLAAGADLPGAVLVTGGLVLGSYTIVDIGRYGWVSAHTLGFGAISTVLLTGFVIRQATARTPLLALRVFRSRKVSGAIVVQMLTLSAMFAFQVVVALYMQRVLGYTALQTGLAMLPAAIGIGAVSLFASAPLSARFGTRNVLFGGLVLLLAGMTWLTRVPVHGHYVTDLLPMMVAIGGGGLVLPALAALGMSGASERDAGVASGLFNTTQQLGMALGVAVLSTLAAARAENLSAAGMSEAAALTGGYRLAFLAAAVSLAAALAVTAVVLRPATPAEAVSELPVPVN
ncbi:MFS transporter [Nocardia stercoris]|uniref:DHA2 family efflux MFS transporter permease subunit n=1 Tax=Nocardia stercoris TaxID=2483361 RepID=A0A3M2KUN7_9NOCA|nr:MFS transporter [Nocardia stercoris]RMI28356.1 DHA2 family efflux MFS transporter permease subunit [Nocardia stercoris]